MTAPTNGTFTSNTEPTLSATAADNTGGSGLAGVQFQYSSNSGSTWNNVGNTQTTAPFSVTFTTALALGAYEARAVATDKAGNSATSPAVTFTIGNGTLSVGITAPSGATNVNKPMLSATASETGGTGLKNVQFEYSTNGGSTWINAGAAQTTAPFSFTFTTALPDGNYQVRAVATDNSGNTATTSVVSFTIDTVAPTVTMTAPADGTTTSNAKPTLSATAADNTGGSGLASVQFEYTSDGGTNWNDAGPAQTTAPFTFTFTTPLADGNYAAAAIATDNAGNATASSVVSFTVTATVDAPLTADGLAAPHGTGTPVVIALGTGEGLSSPVDPAYYNGNLYVPNAVSNTISLVTPSGGISTYVSSSQLNTPDGVAFDSAGNLYVANFHGENISKVTPQGVVTTFASVNSPNGPVFGPDGNLYVCDKYDNMIMKVTPGGAVSTFVGNNQGLDYPIALAFDGVNLYVASENNDTIYEVTPAGNVSTFVTGGPISGPTALVFGPDGNFYVYNSGTSDITEVTPSKVETTFATLDGAAAGTYAGLAFDPVGNLYVANNGNSTISQLTPPPLVEGQAFTNQTVFHFTDADPSGTASQYAAIVTLGDGNSVTLDSGGVVGSPPPGASGKIVANPAGGFDVQLSYTYDEELFNQTFSVQVNDSGGASTRASTSTFSVDDAPLEGSSAAKAGGSADVANSSILSGATFTDSNPGNHSGDFTAVITWGDGGPTSSGTVSYDSGIYTVSGSHTYADAGNFPISIAVTDQGGSTTAITGAATVNTAGGNTLFSDSFDRPDATQDNLGQADNFEGGTGTYYYVPVFSGAVISSDTLEPSSVDYGGVEFSASSNTGATRGTPIGQDLDITVNLLVPTDSADDTTDGGIFFRSRAAFTNDGLVGGEPFDPSGGYWVRLTNSGVIQVVDLRTNTVTASTTQPESFDSTIFHRLEVAFNGNGVQVALDGYLQIFGADGPTVAIPSTGLPGDSTLPGDVSPGNDGCAGLAFGVQPSGKGATGTEATDLMVTSFSSIAGLPTNLTTPYSTVNPLPATTASTSFTVSWTGWPGPGADSIASYSVFVSKDGGSFTPFVSHTSQTSATFSGQAGHNYAFYSVATDNLGNVEPTPSAAEATTTIAGPPTSTVTPLPASTTSTTITVSWSGSPGAGATSITSYEIFVSVDGGPFSPIVPHTTATSETFTADPGHTYGFYSVATNNLGLVQTVPTSAQAMIAVTNPAPPPVAPKVIGEKAIFQRKLKKGKPVGPAVLTGFSLTFNTSLYQSTAINPGYYQLDTVTTKKVKKKTTTILHRITGFTVSCVADTVDLNLIGKQTFPTGGQLTIVSTSSRGVTGTSGLPISGVTVFAISKSGKSITPSH